ncbi:MAG: gliding motility lipoprotein GldH [Bacteroidales bacterium]|nr:gliding motility lipoprotein GldH [Bacteroidales bacterium]
MNWSKGIRLFFIGSVLSGIFICTSCNQAKVYDTYHAVDPEGWYKGDTLVFTPEISDTGHLYNFIIKVRHNTDYKYRNLYLFATTRFPGGNTTKDTIELMLAKKDGEWLGRGFGAIKTTPQMIIQRARFHSEGEYRFELRQAMRADSLQGIEDIGIRIEKYK